MGAGPQASPSDTLAAWMGRRRGARPVMGVGVDETSLPEPLKALGGGWPSGAGPYQGCGEG